MTVIKVLEDQWEPRVLAIHGLSKCRMDSETETSLVYPEGRTGNKSRDRTSELLVHGKRFVRTSIYMCILLTDTSRDTYIHTESNGTLYGVRTRAHPLHELFVRAERNGGLRETGGP